MSIARPFAITLSLVTGLLLPQAHAETTQAYPSKPIRLIVPFAPGGGTDITARAIAQKLTERWGQQVVVDNRPGANGTIGLDLAAHAPADGYTLTMISASHSVNVSLFRKLPYNLIQDFAPVTQATSQPYALVVHPSVPAKSVQDLVALARAKPGALNYGSSGSGGFSHLSGALFASLARINITHIPYKGGNPALTDVIAGQIQMLFSTLLQSDAHIRSGRLRALAVTTTKRSPAAPDVPTMQEAGVKDFQFTQWLALLAPASTPPAVVTRLNAALRNALNSKDVRDKFQAQAFESFITSPEDAGKFIASEAQRFAQLIKAKGITAN